MPAVAQSMIVAASASEWCFVRSLALAATPTKPEQAPGIRPIANEAGGVFACDPTMPE